MGKKEIVIKVQNEGVYFNTEYIIPIERTNVPTKYMAFKEHIPIFWLVEMVEYDHELGHLSLRVKNYRNVDTTSFHSQKPKKEVKSVSFEKVDWLELAPQLSYHHKKPLRDFVFNPDAVAISVEEPFVHVLKTISATESNTLQQDNEAFIEEFSVYFTESTFKLGCVCFKKFIQRLGKEVDFSIPNEHILPEFDSIKTWFSKKLKSKKFKVTATIVIANNNITIRDIHSPLVNQITPELIDGVKHQRIFSLSKAPLITMPDKSLFTSEDIFSQFEEETTGNTFKQTDDDILQFLIEKHNVRNAKQLRYLAGKKQSAEHKLRYTLNPNFGFLFFVEGEENNHFVWELLNSHATYIWSIEKSMIKVETQFKRMEGIISTIRTLGRDRYKKAYINNGQDNDLTFVSIPHKDVGSEFIDGFPKWKSRLEEQLI